jgi:hypothetical protein
VLHQLKTTPAQLKTLADLAATTASRPGPRKVIKLSEKYHKTLQAVRSALIEGDEEEIDKQFAALEELRESEEPEFDDVEITAEARKAAPGLLRKFSARQLVAYLSASGDDFPDPTEQLKKGLEQSRELKDREWRDYRDNLAYQVGWLCSGVNEAGETRVRDQVLALLNKASSLDARAFKEQREQLETSAQEIVGKLSSTDVIRNYLERTVAELLSNPRLPAALEARQKKVKSS